MVLKLALSKKVFFLFLFCQSQIFGRPCGSSSAGASNKRALRPSPAIYPYPYSNYTVQIIQSTVCNDAKGVFDDHMG